MELATSPAERLYPLCRNCIFYTECIRFNCLKRNCSYYKNNNLQIIQEVIEDIKNRQGGIHYAI